MCPCRLLFWFEPCRPNRVGDIVFDLVDYTALVEGTLAVLETLVPGAQRVQTQQGDWSLMRVDRYRTLGNLIAAR